MNQVAGSAPKKGLQLRDSGPYPTITLESSTGSAVNAKLALEELFTIKAHVFFFFFK